jgi:molybdopterin biosynthesis enzyme
MATHTITLDEATEADLQRLSAKEGRQASEYAARLLARAVRAARPRPVFDSATLKAYAADNAAEEEALADSDLQHRAELLAEEERA